MRIVGLKLTNFRIFRELEWSFGEQDLVAFIGENGGGKSAVLDALGVGLAILNDQLIGERYDKVPRHYLRSDDISIGARQCLVRVSIKSSDEEFTIDAMIHDDVKGRHSYGISGSRPFEEYRSSIWNLESTIPAYFTFDVDRARVINTISSDNSTSNESFEYHHKNTIRGEEAPYNLFRRWFIVEHTVEVEQKVKQRDFDLNILSLFIIRHAVTKFLEQLNFGTNIKISVAHTNNGILDVFGGEWDNRSELIIIEKDGQEILMDYLSSGEKGVIILCVEIARRLYLSKRDTGALANSAIVLIDEIELHLHPAWQRRVLPALRATFPNVQFFVTTHSPQTLSTLNREQIIEVRDGELFSASADPKGRDTNGILEELMGVDKRPEEVDDLIDEIMEGIYSEQPDFAAAEAKIERLKSLVATGDPILLRIDSVIRRCKALA